MMLVRTASPRRVVAVCALAMASALCLVACGGGGGDEASPPVNNPPVNNPPAGDTTPPTVVSSNPTSAATNVATNSTLTVTFSESMSATSISASTFTLVSVGSGASVTGSVSAAGDIATFTPASTLTANAQYTVTVGTGVRDVAGNSLATPYTWSFTTAAAGDTTPPIVVSTFPAAGSAGVGTGASLMATFSEALNASSVTNTTFTLSITGGGAVAGSVSLTGNTAALVPTTTLLPGTSYTARLTTGIRDVAGNAMGAAFTWSFTTATATDTTPPTVTSVTPTNGATGVAASASITASFSEAVDGSSLDTSSFVVVETSTSAAVGGAVVTNGSTATFTPSQPLKVLTQYTATLTSAVRDAAGNHLVTVFAWSFTTSSSASPTLGAHTLAFARFQNSATQVSTGAMQTQSGSVIVAGVANGTVGSLQPPTDTLGNTYTRFGNAHTYTSYPTSGTAVYAATNANGGGSHVVTELKQNGEEVTLAAIEVRNGSSVNTVWREVLSPNTLTSADITTTGPAVLIAFWWGDADGSVAHTAVPDSGFTVIDSVLLQGSLVQCAVATRTVSAAGTYHVTWTATPTQGAQLWLVAVQ